MNILNNVLTIIIGLLGAIFFFAMELFIIPGFGIMGILGIILISITVYTSYSNLGAEAGFYTIFAGLLLSGLFFYYFIKKKLFKKTTLQYRLSKEDGFAIRHLLIDEFLNKQGEALTNLRPIGIVGIDKERLDAITEGTSYIQKGSKVTVVGIEGNKLIVKETKEVQK